MWSDCVGLGQAPKQYTKVRWENEKFSEKTPHFLFNLMRTGGKQVDHQHAGDN